ncbi:uncharacterized protein LOC117288915 [Asterias rubens]|uniref:uncharacterized protein LOC117288915 n=1 Tax=Asterias rubens TaxID=7604 RepID=UPI00145596FF|nr:uncharacterized protein LOC117288915 [Asterias rubens]
MEPANEHDPTMDADIVHATNVHNKKEVAEMRFLTKSLENARHVQANIHRQEEKDLLKQLWKLHKEKERRHSEMNYIHSGSRVGQGSSEKIVSSISSRHGSVRYLEHPKHHQFAHHQTYDDRNSYHDVRHAYHSEDVHNTTGTRHVESKANGKSRHHVPFIEDVSHHYGPVVHHRPADYFPHPPAPRHGHAKHGYQPPTDVPWVGSNSSNLNVIVQPAGYGHSVKEHAHQLKKPKHYNKGKLYEPHHPHHHHHHTSSVHPLDDIRNAGSLESLTRYITLLDYESSQDRLENGQRRKPHRHPKERESRDHTDKDGSRAVSGNIYEGTGEQDVKRDKTRVEDIDVTAHHAPLAERQQRKENSDKTKSIGLVAVTSSDTPSLTMGNLVESAPEGVQQSADSKTQGHTKEHNTSALENEPLAKHAVKSHGKGLNINGVAVSNRSGKSHRTSSVELAAEHQESYHHPHVNNRTVADIGAHQSSHHHHRYSSHHHPTHHYPTHHHPTHHHLEPRVGSVTVAERKRLAVELLAREFPILLRHAPTKFNPLDALMCQYLRLSTSNVETLEQMCREAGLEVDAHPHQQIKNISQYVFGIGNEKI